MQQVTVKHPQFASAAWGWRELEVPEYFRCVTHLGLKLVEVNAHSETPKHLLNTFSEEAVEKVAHWAEEADVKIVCLAADNDFTLSNESDLEAEIQKVCRFVDMAQRLGTKLIRIFSGGDKVEYVPLEMFTQLHYAFNCVGDYAEARGIELAIENHGGVTGTGQRMLHLMEGIKSPAVGVNFDPANFLMAGADPLMALRNILPWVKYTHWKDVRWENGKAEYCALGEGEMVCQPIVKELLKANYQGYWVIEYEESVDVQRGTQDSVTYLKQVFQEVT
ncbi:MAG: sugar phosphate isomerase/epimerase [Rhizonema sp. PD37]|nr:sugar phosphate isomerase/epimerase [Rhizonema sp. PD37]